MVWLRANYDRAAVLAAAVFLILCAFFIFLHASGFGVRFGALQNVPPRNNTIPAGQARATIDQLHSQAVFDDKVPG